MEVALTDDKFPIVPNSEECSKQTLADATYYAFHLLKEEQIIADTLSEEISELAREIGHEICHLVKEMFLARRQIKIEEAMIPVMYELSEGHNETNEISYDDKHELQVDELESPSSSNDEVDEDGSYDPSCEDIPRKLSETSWETKVKVVRLAKLHPNWSIKSLRKFGTNKLRSAQQLAKWKKSVERNGGEIDKYLKINNRTYNKFKEARKMKLKVSNEMIREWAKEASQEFTSEGLKFSASKAWLLKFKRKYKINEYVKKDDE